MAVRAMGQTRMAVKRLLFACGPSAICRFVMAVIVDAIKRVFIRRARSHVSVKRGERVQPLIADTNTAAAVVSPASRAWITATTVGAFPHVIFGAVAHVVSRASGDTAKAPAGLRSVRQMAGRNPRTVAALTQAVPMPAASNPSRNKRRQTSEFLAGVVGGWRAVHQEIVAPVTGIPA